MLRVVLFALGFDANDKGTLKGTILQGVNTMFRRGLLCFMVFSSPIGRGGKIRSI